MSKFKEQTLYFSAGFWYNIFMSENKILEVKNLTVMMKERFLVKDVSFSVENGECVGIIGQDRSGKTSLIKAIAGSLPISFGQVIIDGNDISQNSQILKEVSICLDPPMFFKYQSVFENMKFLTSLNEDTTKEDILKVLSDFGLAHKKSTKVLFLSYYEKKLMALALAFLTKAKLFLLDEPFKSLPPDNVDDIKKHIKQIRKQGTSIIITSRNLETIEDMCDRFIFMEDRSIISYLSNEQCQDFDENKTYAFVAVKYPHYAGKLITDSFGMNVKLLGNKVLFDTDEDTLADIVKFLTKNRITIFKAGYLSKKAEKIFADLAPFYKEVKS